VSGYLFLLSILILNVSSALQIPFNRTRKFVFVMQPSHIYVWLLDALQQSTLPFIHSVTASHSGIHMRCAYTPTFNHEVNYPLCASYTGLHVLTHSESTSKSVPKLTSKLTPRSTSTPRRRPRWISDRRPDTRAIPTLRHSPTRSAFKQCYDWEIDSGRFRGGVEDI
jgi:hypothetical protein